MLREKVRGKAGTSTRARASKSKSKPRHNRSIKARQDPGMRERETERKGSQIFQIFGVEKSSASRTKFHYYVTDIQYSSTKLLLDLPTVSLEKRGNFVYNFMAQNTSFIHRYFFLVETVIVSKKWE